MVPKELRQIYPTDGMRNINYYDCAITIDRLKINYNRPTIGGITIIYLITINCFKYIKLETCCTLRLAGSLALIGLTVKVGTLINKVNGSVDYLADSLIHIEVVALARSSLRSVTKVRPKDMRYILIYTAQ